MRVADVYDRKPIKVKSDASLREAAELMASTHASDLMVVDEKGALVGMVSEGDLLRAVIPERGDVIDSDVPLLAGLEMMEAKGREVRDLKVADIMDSTPDTVSIEDPLLKAAQMMMFRMIRRLPVMSEGRLVGSLSRSELCRAVLAEEKEDTP